MPTLVALLSLSAAAHTYLEGSDPVAGAELTGPPREVRLTFNEGVEPQFASVTFAIGSADPVSAETRVDGQSVFAAVPTEGLVDGLTTAAVSWELVYRVVSSDGHPVVGTVAFSVLAGVPAPPGSDPSGVAPGEPSTVGGAPLSPPSAAVIDAPETAVSAPASRRSVAVVLLLTALIVIPIGWVAWRPRREPSS